VEVRRSDQFPPVGQRRAEIDQCPGVERRHGIHHATIAVLATVAMIPTEAGDRVRISVDGTARIGRPKPLDVSPRA